MKCRICEKEMTIDQTVVIGRTEYNKSCQVWFNCTRCNGTYMRDEREFNEIIKNMKVTDEKENTCSKN